MSRPVKCLLNPYWLYGGFPEILISQSSNPVLGYQGTKRTPKYPEMSISLSTPPHLYHMNLSKHPPSVAVILRLINSTPKGINPHHWLWYNYNLIGKTGVWVIYLLKNGDIWPGYLQEKLPPGS